MDQVRERFERSVQKEALLEVLAARETDSELQKRIGFSYPHMELEGLYTKTSVSELKLAALHEDEQTEVLFETEQEESVVPLFMKEEKKAGGATRGTAYHRLMELLDFKQFAGVKEQEKIHHLLKEQVAAVVHRGRMEETDIGLVDLKKVETFLGSRIAMEMAEADREGKLFKEQPFVMAIDAKRVDKKFPAHETMLIQGIIDAYYEKQGRIYLMDYKTDRVSKKEDLIHRYQTQLDYYKEALEKLTGKEVAGVYIYSYHFLDSIAI